jgi:hypothetical protein
MSRSVKTCEEKYTKLFMHHAINHKVQIADSLAIIKKSLSVEIDIW